jgi:hypothetical protein
MSLPGAEIAQSRHPEKILWQISEWIAQLIIQKYSQNKSG